MLERLYRLRYLWLLLTAFASVMLWPGVQRALVVDNSLDVWFLQEDPALVPYHTFQELFGNDEVVVVIVKDRETLLSQKYFDAFIHLTEELEAIPEVAGVIGPGNALVGSAGTAGASAETLLHLNATDTAAVTQALAEQPTLREQLFTQDFKTARFLIVLQTLPDFETRRGDILKRIQASLAAQLPGGSYHVGGVGIIFAGLNALSQQDFSFFLGISYLAMFLLILLIYRKLLLLVYALGTVALATYLTLGIYGTMGYRLNLMTTLLPMIIILLGIMDVLHVVNERKQSGQQGSSPQDAALLPLGNVFRPCLFTSLTTMAGFLALLISPMAILKTFGAFAALGILLSFTMTYLLGLVLLPHVKLTASTTGATAKALPQLLVHVLSHKWAFAVLSLCLCLASTAGVLRLQSDTYTLGYFPKNHRVVQDHFAMEAAWGPYMPLELLVKPKADKPLHEKEVVQAAQAFANAAKQLEGIGRVFGFHSLYQAGLEARYKQKGSRYLGSQFYLNQVQQELTFNYPELTKQFIHLPTQTGRITIAGAMSSANELTAKMDSIMHIAAATLGPGATVTPAGYQPMYADIVQYVTRSQVNSLLLAVVLVFLLVWMFLRNLKLAAIAVIPNFFPILIMFGMMGWLRIALDTATASIAAIALSFCIDDTIHFVHHYQQCRKKGQSPAAARFNTVSHVGPAIVFTSVVLFSGYVLMLFGSLKTVELFGFLTAVAIVAALYSQFFIFPLLLNQFDRKSK